MEKCNNLLEEAMNQGKKSDSIPPLELINAICTHMISRSEMPIDFILNRIDSKGNIIESTQKEERLSKHNFTISPRTVWMDQTHSQGMQMTIINPYEIIFRQTYLPIIVTVIMLLFVGSCIAHQIQIIASQQRTAEMKNIFSHAMIHDMKTPIGSLQLGTHILRKLKPEDFEKRDKYLNLIEEESTHLYSLANRVLTLAKLEKDSLLLNKEAILIRPVIEKLIDRCIHKAVKPISIITHFEAKAIYADKEHFEEIIVNLIDNAIKYSKESILIDITSKKEEKYTQIIIRDNGPGIEDKDQERIFEKFERNTNAIRNQCKGAPTGFGIGLAYVKQMTEAHGGTVNIKSRKGEYSEFTITFPIPTQKL